ncbi:unnamed protein product [Staurois parvus]|uniref:rRNA biogenesis protein RRP36 n=1 Tax=Staurois parvus TaxID=386267 RepID=A0ABN9C680_9NEOB|nr:unnamed protein product [Staurois parvus]
MSSTHRPSSRRRVEPAKSSTHNYITQEKSEDKSDTDQEPTNSHTDFSTMSFEDLLHLQNTVGRKAFYRSMGEPQKTMEGEKPKRTGPLELSSKNPAPFLRKVISSKKTMRRDPRFDDLSGEFKPEVFLNTYKFLDDLKKKEKEVVQTKLKKARDPELREKLQKLIRKMDQQEEASQKQEKLRERQLEYKRQMREDARQGKKPFYLKKGDIRKVEMADKYRELKRKGKLEHFLSKKRKRNSHKDRRKLPNQ